jgi:hypothetical protein
MGFLDLIGFGKKESIDDFRKYIDDVMANGIDDADCRTWEDGEHRHDLAMKKKDFARAILWARKALSLMPEPDSNATMADSLDARILSTNRLTIQSKLKTAYLTLVTYCAKRQTDAIDLNSDVNTLEEIGWGGLKTKIENHFAIETEH